MSSLKKVLVIAICALFLSIQYACSVSALEGLVKFNGGSDVVLLEVAATTEERSLGLMNRDSLDENRGMVFVFRPSQKVTFWMRNTFISLDMIFIDNGKIVKIIENAKVNQIEELYPSDVPVTEVVEVNAGYAKKHNLAVGDLVSFENISAIDYSKKSKLQIFKKG